VRSKSEKADIQAGETETTASRDLPIIYSQELVDRILKTLGVPYPETFPPLKATDADIRGIVLHYAYGPDSSVRFMREGRPDLPGPLAHWVVLSDGTIECIGKEGTRVSHVGRADRGLTHSNTVGVETTGSPTFANELQVENLVRLVADIAERWAVPTEMIVSHAEVALPAGRRADMLQQAPAIRKMVEAVRRGRAAQQSVPADRPAAAPRR
jgi:hypothetical protein